MKFIPLYLFSIAALLFTSFEQSFLDEIFMSSDSLTLQYVFQEMLNHRSFFEITLSHAPSFIPELATNILLKLLTGDIYITQYLTGVANLIFVQGMFILLIKRVFNGYIKSTDNFILVLSIFNLLLPTHSLALLYFILLNPQFHTGIIALSIILILLRLSYYKARFVLIFLITTVAVASNPLIIFLYIIPIFSILGIQIVAYGINKKSLKSFVQRWIPKDTLSSINEAAINRVTTIGDSVRHAFFSLMPEISGLCLGLVLYVNFNVHPGYIGLGYLETENIVYNDLLVNISWSPKKLSLFINPFFFIIPVCAIFLISARDILRQKNSQTDMRQVRFVLLFFLANLFSSTFLFLFLNHSVILDLRYYTFFILAMLMVSSMYLANLLALKIGVYKTKVFLLLIFFTICFLRVTTFQSSVFTLDKDEAEDYKCLMNTIKTNNLKYGIASHWIGPKLELLSDFEIQTADIFRQKDQVYINRVLGNRTVNNLNLPYDYVITNNALPYKTHLNLWGPPTKEFECSEKYSILIYETGIINARLTKR